MLHVVRVAHGLSERLAADLLVSIHSRTAYRTSGNVSRFPPIDSKEWPAFGTPTNSSARWQLPRRAASLPRGGEPADAADDDAAAYAGSDSMALGVLVRRFSRPGAKSLA